MQADKLNAIIADLYGRGHLQAKEKDQPFEPWFSDIAKNEILDCALEDKEFIKPFINEQGLPNTLRAIEAALNLVTDDDPMRGCDEYRRIAAEHDRDLPKDTAGLEKR